MYTSVGNDVTFGRDVLARIGQSWDSRVTRLSRHYTALQSLWDAGISNIQPLLQ